MNNRPIIIREEQLAKALEAVRGNNGFYFTTNKEWDKGGNEDAARAIFEALWVGQ